MSSIQTKRTKTNDDMLINARTIEGVKKEITALFDKQADIKILVKKSKVRQEEYAAKIIGVYPSFFTVEDEKLNIAFSIQYIDILTGAIKIIG